MSGLLNGIRVVELARILAGPWAGQTLADLGADVIKIESPDGDDTRRWGPPFIHRDNGDEEAAYFHSTNRGKRSITLDFKNQSDRDKARDLIRTADVVIENFKVGGLAKYGLDYESLLELNPKLIYCSITGFGQDGPYSKRAGYDYIIQGMSGLMSVTGPEDQPYKVGVAVTDIFTGIYATTAILAALHRRQETGVGLHVDMALMDSAVSIMANQAMNYLSTGVAPKRMGNMHPNLSPYQVFPCSDGHIIVATGNDQQFERLCSLLSLEGVAHAPKYKTNADRVANRDELSGLLSDITTSWSKKALLDGCEALGIPAGPINNLEEVFSDPQVIARGMQLDMNGLSGVRSPFRFSDGNADMSRPSPLLGEHNAEIDDELYESGACDKAYWND